MNQSRPERYYLWLAIAAFLAPLLGGQLSLDPQPLAPGGLLVSIFREPQGAVVGHFLIFLPIVVGLFVTLIRRSVLQMPHPRTVAVWAIFALILLISVAISSYRYASLQSLLEWWAYLVAFFAAITMVGRTDGPRAIAGAFAGGSALVALLAIREYAEQPDPAWRVIANWLNPNALAALMVMGIFVSIASYAKNDQNRMSMLGPILGALLCSVGLVLTGSKGGFLALGVGALTFLLAQLPSGGKATIRSVGILVGAVIGGALLANLLVMSHRKPNANTQAGGAFTRIANAGATQEQSSGFRKLLWTTSIELIKDNPMGRGLGTFRHHSAKTGLVTQTQLAHQSYLQMGVETGIGGLVLFTAALGLSLLEVLRGSRGQPSETAMLRSGILAALVGLAAHAMVDSDFSHFGLGLAFFLLLGTLFQLAGDATVPEFTPRALRGLAGALTGLVALGMLYFGILDIQLGELRYAIGARDFQGANAAFEAVRGLAPADPRVWTLGARIAPSLESRIDYLEEAIRLGPTPMLHRQLADTLKEKGDLLGAERELNASLTFDPNNLYSLKQLLEIAKSRDAEQARRIAQRLVDVESKSYFKIRSIPELVPTETYEARAYLAESMGGADKASMLKPAIDGYLQYAALTVPPIVNFGKAGMDGSFGGVTVAEARAKLETAMNLCDTLGAADDKQSEWAQESRKQLAEALGVLPG